MADINYLNPTSIAPKFDWQPKNALAGMSWVENRNDYRGLLEQQIRLQQLAEQERRMELEQKQKDIPLQDLKRQGQIDFTRGQNPYQEQLGATGAQANITTNQIQGSQQRLNAELGRFVQGLNDEQYKQYERGMKTAEPILSQALQLSKTPGGEMRAQQYVQEMFQRAKSAGIDMPPMMLDPRNWEALYKAAVETPQHRQKMDEVEQQGINSANVANISGKWGFERQQIENDSAERRANTAANASIQASKNRTQQQRFPGMDQNLNRLATSIASSIESGEEPPESLISEFIVTRGREYDKQNAQMKFLTLNDPKLKEAFEEDKIRSIQRDLTNLGVTKLPGAKKPTPGPTDQRGRKPLSSFN